MPADDGLGPDEDEEFADRLAALGEQITAATLLARLPINRLGTAPSGSLRRPLPAERSSGTSVRRRSRTGPLGPANVRRALYLLALTAMRLNPPLRAFTDRLRTAGKPPRWSAPRSCASSCS